MRFIYILFFFIFILSKSVSAQKFDEKEAQNVLNQLKREQQLIKLNSTISQDKKALLLTQFGLLQEAQKLINEHFELSYEWLYTSALFYTSIKHYRQALSLAKKAYKIQPSKRELLMLLGDIYINTLDIQQALQIAETRLAQVDFDDQAFVLKAKANILASKFSIANKYATRAIDINKNNAEAWFVKAQIEKNENIDFLNSITNCLKLNPYHSDARVFLATYLKESDAETAQLNTKIALLKEPFNIEAHQFLLEYHQNSFSTSKLKAANQILNNIDVKIDDTSFEKELNFIKDFRQRILSENLKENTLVSAALLKESGISRVLFHASYLELINAGMAVDKLGIQNLNELAVFDSKNPLKEDKLFEKVFGSFSSIGQLLVLSGNSPSIRFIPTSKNDYPLYKIFNAFFNNNELIVQFTQRIYEEQMPLQFQREYRKWAMECHQAKWKFKDDMFRFLLKSDNENSCDSLLIYFSGLSETLQSKNSGINDFKAEAITQKANQLILDNDFLEAEQVIQLALNEKARYNTALLAQSKVCAALDRYEEAKLWLQTAIETTPLESEVYKTEGLLSLINFEKGKINPETAFNEISIAYAKAISLEKDPFIFGKLNREIQDILKFFGKNKDGLQLAEAYLSQKANKSTPYEKNWLEETKAFSTSIRVNQGYHKKNQPIALKLIQDNSNNLQIHKMLWLAFNQSYEDTLLIFINKINLFDSSNLEKVGKQKIPMQIDGYYNQLLFLQKVLEQIGKKEIEKASNSLKAVSFSKIPEVWSYYQYVRANLLIAKGDTLEASNVLFSSIVSLPSNFGSLSLLKKLKNSTKNRLIKKNYKKGNKIVQKLNVVPGPKYNL